MRLPLEPVLIDVLHRNFNATPGGDWDEVATMITPCACSLLFPLTVIHSEHVRSPPRSLKEKR